MILRDTPLAGLVVVEQERLHDERGFFARTFDADLLGRIVQMSTSFNEAAGTLRGLHFQRSPHGERKLVRCTRGAIFDVAVDLRPGSETLHGWHAEELTAENGLALSIPAGFAHGFLTLSDDSEVLYAMDAPYVPEAASGVRWDDAAFGIDWPVRPRTLSHKDSSWPLAGS